MTISRLPRYLQDVFKTFCKTGNYYAGGVFKACLEDVFQTLWRLKHVCWALGYFTNAFEFCLNFEILPDFSLFIFGSD